MKRIGLLPLSLAAISAASAQSIKPHPLGAVQSTSKEVLGNPTLARALPNGSVIVNDVASRRLLLLDPSLETAAVIADSTSGSVNGYGQRPGALIPYVADSTLFLDATSSSFLVIDPSGKVARVMSPPRPNDNGFIANSGFGYPGFDSKGRMVYRANIRPPLQQLRDGTMQIATPPDSQPVLRVDLDTRRADTIGYVRTPKSVPTPVTLPTGQTVNLTMQVPLATIDDWAVLSDGSIALVRGQDYRVDFIKPDGSHVRSEKVAFDWKRLSDDDKLAIVDSIQKARAAAAQAGGPIGGGGPVMMFGGGDGARIVMGGGGGRGDVMVAEQKMVVGAVAAAAAPAAAGTSSTSATSGRGGEPAKAGADSGKAAAGGPAAFTMPALPAPAIADIPDYMPPFTQVSARPDADANLWIRTTTPGAQPGNVVYDVVNSQGILVDRVDVPKGMTIVGFGKGGIVYLSQREGYQFRVLKASVK